MAKNYAFAVAAAAVATIVAFSMYGFFELTNLVMAYLLATLAVAARGHRGPAAVSAILNVLCFDFFFVPPRFTLSVTDAQYVVTFVVMFVTAMTISHLAIRLRSEAEIAREGQIRTALMYTFTQELARARGVREVLATAVSHVSSTFNSTVAAFVPNVAGQVEMKAGSSGIALTEKQVGVAQWVYDRGQTAGMKTGALPDEDALYVPILSANGSVGVLKVKPNDQETFSEKEQRLLLDSFCHQIALALEVDRLQENAKEAEIEAETERLRSSLLSSVSHDFRTPLTAIVGSASTLLEKDDVRTGPKGVELIRSIQSEAERLSRLVQNLLETTRLESGRVQLKKEKYPLEEIVGSALERLSRPLQSRKVTLEVPEDLPPVAIDGILIEQVIINLIENALRHAPATSPIEISAKAENGAVVVSVADHGPGVKNEDLERVFEKFFRDPSSPGAGLGLAICRGVVKAHGGTIWVENRQTGGAIFKFTLPLGAA